MVKKFKPTEAQKKEVDDLIDKWQVLLFLNSWELTVRYAEYPDNNPDGITRADIRSDFQYHEGMITFYPAFFETSTEKRERAIVHELIHAVVDPIEQQIKDLLNGRHVTNNSRIETMERIVTWLANAIHTLDIDRQKMMKTKRSRQ